MNIAIIPARKNSQRLKNKNIKFFFGKPVIYYSIREAKKTKLFDKIIVTTDSEKIKKIALKYGADIVIDRKKKLSKNYISIVQVIKDAINSLNKLNIKCKYICCIFPASPLIKFTNIIRGYKKILSKKNFDFVFAAKILNTKNQNIFILKNDKIKKLKILNNTYTKIATDAGQFYWGCKASWLQNNSTFTKNISSVALDEYRAQDMNTIYDWNLSKMLFKLK